MSVYYCQEHKRDFKPDECISCEISKDLLDKDDEIKRLREIEKAARVFVTESYRPSSISGDAARFDKLIKTLEVKGE